jgi:hypothetical protein
MTAQKPAPKAGSVCALPASFSSDTPAPQTAVKEDFLAMILQVLTGQQGAADNPPSAQPAKEKPSSTETAAPDANAASMLLALLAPPLPTLAKAPAHKAVGQVGQVGLVGPDGLSAPSPAATADQSAPEAKPQRQDAAATLPESKTPPPSGTPVANTSPGMSLKPQRNEIAAKTEQKLPLAAVSSTNSADTGAPSPDGGTQTPLSFSWHEAPSEQLAIIDLSTKAGSVSAPVAEASADAPVRVSSPVPIERLEQMISREVMTIRQTGAQTLGVALKLDSNTQLFLQLTTNNGLVQASVRCDRGQFAPEDSQWAQLQESLARQNVELLPMAGSSNLNFQQPSGQHQRQPAAREDWPSADAAVPPAQQRKQKEQNRSRKNWESWA